jgi:Outer membrane protein beta-barrel domain
MSSTRWMPLMRRVTMLSAAVFFAAGAASAQSSPTATPSSQASSWSDSSSSLQLVADNDVEAAALPSAPTPAAAGAGQNGGAYRSHSLWSRFTFGVGGGFNAPTSDSSSYITWGGNFNVDGGLVINPRLSVMAEYGFIDDKLPGAVIAETGATGGHAHIWSLTLEPIVDLFPKSTNDVYVTGGGGFYRKVTSFTDPQESEYCYYFYCGIVTENVVVGHFSSNQGGWNIGGGYQHRMGGMYGDSRMKLFVEARYLDVMSPASEIAPNGLGTAVVGDGTKIVPVTFGVRW